MNTLQNSFVTVFFCVFPTLIISQREMPTIFESTKEFDLGISFTNTDVLLIQECIDLATEHPELSMHWTNVIVLITTMMDAPQRALFHFDRLYPNAIEMAVFGGHEEDPIIVVDDDEL